MANEQTSVPLYAASEVLTAANMNISAGTGVPVFATTVTRDAAFGGASEKVLAEGQLCYLSSTNVVQYYDGAAWATVGPAAAATSGLTFISSTSFTTAASVSLPANTFSATYANYLVYIEFSAVSAAQTITGRYRAAGTDNSTGNYANMFTRVTNINTTSIISTNNQTSFSLGSTATSGGQYSGFIQFSNPQTALQSTIIPQLTVVVSGTSQDSITGTGNFSTTTSFDSFSFIASTGTITGTVRAYGYANS